MLVMEFLFIKAIGSHAVTPVGKNSITWVLLEALWNSREDLVSRTFLSELFRNIGSCFLKLQKYPKKTYVVDTIFR